MIPQEADQTHVKYGFPVVKRLDVKIYIWLLTSVTRAKPYAPSRLSGGEHGLIPEQRLNTEPSYKIACFEY